MTLRLRSPLPSFANVTEWVNGEVDSTELEGQPILVHFWSVSCHMCKESLPVINVWREQYEQEFGLKVIGVHMPRSEKDTDLDAAKAVIAEYDLVHPIMLDNEHSVVDAFENEYVPAYYLFDGNHQLRHFQAGEKGLQMVEQRLNKVLGANP